MSTMSNMSNPEKIFEYKEESQSEKLARKSSEQPFFPVAIAGFIAAVAYGAYKYKTRGGISTSLYLMQLRVGAQGIAVGALTVGLIYSILNERFLKKKQ